jgi:hypothetical protein
VSLFRAWRARRRQKRYLRNRVVFIGCGPQQDPRDWQAEFNRTIKP